MYVTKYVSEFDIGDGNVLLVNALTGAVDIATADLLPSLRAGSSTLPGDTLALLKKRGYLFPSAAEEQRLLEHIGSRAHSLRRGKKRPREYIICPTYGCNLACTYCFEREIERRPAEVMTDDQVDAVFDAIDVMRRDEEQPPFIELFGGEPFLPGTRQAITRILTRARERELKVNAITNGTNVVAFEDVFERFAETLHVMQITIDGPAEVHDIRRKRAGGEGTFAQMIEGIDHLVTHGRKVAMRINLDWQNIDSLPRLAELVVDMGWPETGNLKCYAVPVISHVGDTAYPHYMREDEVVSRILDMFEAHPGLSDIIGFQYFKIVNRISHALDLGSTEFAGPNFHYCEATLLDSIVFGVDGHIYPCSEAVAHPEHAVGRYLPKFEMDEEKRALWGNRSALNIPKCRDCEIVSFCAGGCAFSALHTNGDLYKPVCGDARQVLAEYVKYAWAKRGADVAGAAPSRV